MKHIQEESYSKEKANRVDGDRLRSGSRIWDLRAFLDEDGVIRIETRLQNSPAPDETKFPLLLLGENRFTKLLVHHRNVRILHGGINATLCELQKHYWVARGQQNVKRVIGRSKCVFDSSSSTWPPRWQLSFKTA